MTDNEIIKALKELLEIMLCEGDLQRSATISKALDLINRQKAEIERLRGVIEKTDAAFYQKVGEVDRAKADAIKVRCKDCKHRHKVNTGLAIWQVCHRLNRQTDDDFYCAYGERKDDNG